MDTLARKGPDPEPEPRILYVPVRVCVEGIVAIRTGRLPSGELVGLGFTSPESLAVVFGSEQAWMLVDLRALHELLTPRGISRVQVDPMAAPVPPSQPLDRLMSVFRVRGWHRSLRTRERSPPRRKKSRLNSLRTPSPGYVRSPGPGNRQLINMISAVFAGIQTWLRQPNLWLAGLTRTTRRCRTATGCASRSEHALFFTSERLSRNGTPTLAQQIAFNPIHNVKRRNRHYGRSCVPGMRRLRQGSTSVLLAGDDVDPEPWWRRERQADDSHVEMSHIQFFEQVIGSALGCMFAWQLCVRRTN